MTRADKPSRRGSVMIEFVFVLPFLAFILFLIFFFGWSMMNQQHVKSAARYTAWRHVVGASDAGGMDINQSFFDRKATPDSVTIAYGAGNMQTLQDYADEVSHDDQQAGALAQTLAMQVFPRGCESHVGAAFPTSVRLWQQFEGSITGQGGREGVEWRRGQADLMQPMAGQFLHDLDMTLDGIGGSGRPLAQVMRQLYLAHW